ncbi:AraC family transcriptional regulator [Enterocloster citroniae]
MEWVGRFNQAMEYIEEHITEETDYEALGRIVCCSAYQFQRMFAFMSDIPLSEYIRRRKMSLAAVDLQRGRRIIDIALKYGYSSPTAFTRAFCTVHGMAPSRAKQEGVMLKTYPPLSFKLVVKGTEELNYRIERRDCFRVAGISRVLARDMEENFKTVPDMWDRAVMDGTIDRMLSIMDREPGGLLGLTACGSREVWKYYIAVPITRTGHGFEEYTVPSSMWAIFPGEGTNRTLQDLERRVVTEWLPNSGYEYGTAPDVELYIHADPDHAQYEYWLPVTVGKERPI